MRTSIATVCLSGTLEEKMRAAASAGFDGIEVFEPDLVVSPSSPEQLRELAAELGLSLDMYQPFRDGVEVAPETFPDSLRRLRAKCELMNRLGTTVLMLMTLLGAAVALLPVWRSDVHLNLQLLLVTLLLMLVAAVAVALALQIGFGAGLVYAGQVVVLP